MLRKTSSLAPLSLVLALTAIVMPSNLVWPTVVQAVSTEATATAPTTDTVRIDGSGSMAAINIALQQSLTQQNPAATVTAATNGTAAGLQALREGKVDLAAIGRDLTDAEKAEGLVAVPVQREKVAMIVGETNPYNGSMSIGQFAAMFRGEVTDWSAIGGPAGAVRFIDQPEASDTRSALGNYPAFKSAPFTNGITTTRIPDETAQSIASALGNDGIGYVVFSQAQNLPGTKIVTMHQTLPNDPRYPFSQSSAYVYRKGQLTPAAKAFLQNLNQPTAIAALQTAAAAGATILLPNNPALTTALTEATASPGAIAPTAPVAVQPVAPVTAPVNAPSSGLPWWLLLIPIGAGLAWWALKPRGGSTITAAPPIEPSITPPNFVAPVPDVPIAPDTGIAPFNVAAPSPTPEPEPQAPSATGQLNLLGLGAAAGGVALGAAAIANAIPDDDADRPTVVPGQLDLPGLGAAAGILGAEIARPETAMTEPGGFQPIDQLPAIEQPPIAPIDNAPAPITAVPTGVEPPAAPLVQPLPTATGSLDATIVGVGLGAVGLGAAGRSDVFTMAANMPDERMVVRLTQSNVEATKYDVGQSEPEVAASQFSSTDTSVRALADVDEGFGALPGGYGESRLILMSREPQWAYAYWDVPEEMRQPLRTQGGQQLALRLYDVTDMPPSQQQPHSVQQYEIDELAQNWYLPIPVSDREYVAELGYLATGGRWLSLVRSNSVSVPPVYPSDWEDTQMVTIGWEETLVGRQFVNLKPPQAEPLNTLHETMYQISHPEHGSIAGSVFAGMSGAAFETMSSFTVPGAMGQWALPTTSGLSMSGIGMSGIGMAGFDQSGFDQSGLDMLGMEMAIPNMSGIGMSGIGMSGIGMSGIGMFAVTPRARQFWLVADAELIVYGATEPTASLTIGGEPIKLSADGTFRLQMSFQDGNLRFPIMAVAEDGEQMRQVELRFDRQTPQRRTNTKEEAQPEQLD
jgi:ABC-type phosphate transport system substrate-binding protein